MANNNIFFSLIWLIVLIFIAWPIALCCAWLWILLQVSTSLLFVEHPTIPCRCQQRKNSRHLTVTSINACVSY